MKTPVQWEYLTVEIVLSHVNGRTLNDFGLEGWELVDVVHYGTSTLHYFKRPIEGE